MDAVSVLHAATCVRGPSACAVPAAATMAVAEARAGRRRGQKSPHLPGRGSVRGERILSPPLPPSLSFLSLSTCQACMTRCFHPCTHKRTHTLSCGTGRCTAKRERERERESQRVLLGNRNSRSTRAIFQDLTCTRDITIGKISDSLENLLRWAKYAAWRCMNLHGCPCAWRLPAPGVCLRDHCAGF